MLLTLQRLKKRLAGDPGIRIDGTTVMYIFNKSTSHSEVFARELDATDIVLRFHRIKAMWRCLAPENIPAGRAYQEYKDIKNEDLIRG